VKPLDRLKLAREKLVILAQAFQITGNSGMAEVLFELGVEIELAMVQLPVEEKVPVKKCLLEALKETLR
jgi:hypothetical protein